MSSAGYRTDRIIEQAKDTKEKLLAAAAAMQDYIDGKLTRAELEEALGITLNASQRLLADGGRTYIRKTVSSARELARCLARFRTPGERLLDAAFDAGRTRGDVPVRPADYPEFDEELLWEEAEKALPPHDFGIVKLRFGRDGGDPMTYQEIAERCGVSWQRIQQIVSQFLDKIRKPRFLKKIFPDLVAQAPLTPLAPSGPGAADAEAMREDLSGLQAECRALREENASLRNRLSLAAGIIGAPPAERAAPGGIRSADTRFSAMLREGTMPKRLRIPLSKSKYKDLAELAAAPAEDIAKLHRVGPGRLLEIADLIEDMLGIRRDDIRKLAAERKACDESYPSNRKPAAERAGENG